MDIELARTFLEITRCGSLAAAAEKLHVTQTAITARVKNLESQLNSTGNPEFATIMKVMKALGLKLHATVG